MALSPEQKKQAEQAAAVAALVAAQAKAFDQLEESLVAQVKKLMGQLFNKWFFQADVDKIVKKLVELVRESQVAIADMTEAYLDNVYEAMDIPIPKSKRNVHVKLPPRLRNVDPLTEWNRPARVARTSRLLGADEFEANEKALQRAEQLARMDAQLAMREAEQQRWGIAEGIIGYRRIIHPELSKHGVCGLCVVAANRIYQKEKLKAVHNGCNCTVLPVTKTQDPGLNLNRDDLDAFYKAAGSNRRADLQRVVVKTLDHGELGPILVDNKYKNRTASQTKSLAETKKFDPAELFKIQDQIVRKFEASAKAGKTPQFDINFHRRMRAKYAKELGISIIDAA